MAQPRKLHDKYFLQAKAEGYLARSAYKLLEMNEKRRLIRRDDRVIDLGCAPGSWLQVVEKIVGPEGRIVGIDLQEIHYDFGPNVITLVGDAFATEGRTLRDALGGKLAHVLLSDMAPNTTGHGDDFLSARLCRRVLELAPYVLKPGGNLIMKVLEGHDMPDLINEARAVFDECGATKPAASRDISRETFIWGKRYRKPSKADRPKKPGIPEILPGQGWGRQGPTATDHPPAGQQRNPGKGDRKGQGGGEGEGQGEGQP